MGTNKNTLLVDCGNTFIKWCLLDGDNLTNQQSEYHKETSVLETFKNIVDAQASHCDSIVMVSVLGEVFLAGAKRIADDADLDFLEAHSQEKLANVINGYEDPEKLGSDRLVAMIGAYDLIDDLEACIVIDSGTATTIDAVDEAGQHLGGVIYPGFELSMKSLSNNTEQLPRFDSSQQQIEEHGLANNTNEAIASGCLLSLASSIDGICNKMLRQIEASSTQSSVRVKRIICGGGSNAVLPHLENEYEYHENLVMLGLKKIKEDTLAND